MYAKKLAQVWKIQKKWGIKNIHLLNPLFEVTRILV